MLRTLLFAVALGVFALSATAGDDVPKTDVKPEVKVEKFNVEVYRLRNIDSNEVLLAFNGLMGHGTTVGGPRVTGPGRGSATGGGGAGGKAGRGGMANPGGGGGFTRPGIIDEDDPRYIVRTAPTPVCRAVSDNRTSSLVVRGTEKDQRVAAEVVAILDVEDGKPLPATKAVTAIRLKNVNADDLVALLQMLDPTMSYRLAPVVRNKVLLAVGNDEQMKELADSVKKLDIPSEKK